MRDAVIHITFILALITRKIVTVAMVVWSICHPISALLVFTPDKKVSSEKKMGGSKAKCFVEGNPILI